jgi:diguanylate cyclase (GGDEF)-like protein/PAS domain S-box-containing protein
MRLTFERRIGNLRRDSPAHLVGLTQRFLQSGGPLKTVLPYGRKGSKKGGRANSNGHASRGAGSETQLAIGTFNQSAIGTALIELNGNWIRVNPALCQILGYSEQELLAKTFQSITHPEDLGPELKRISQVLRGEIRSFQMEKRYLHQAGHTVPALLSVSVVFDSKDKPRFLCYQLQDISERKQEEEKLRGSEDSYRRLVELSPDAILVQRRGTIIYANAACGALLGASSAEGLLGKSVLQFVHPDDREAVKKRIEIVREDPGAPPPPRTERRYIGLDGREVHVEVVINRITYQSEPATEAILRDISERKHAEAQLREANQKLAERVQELDRRSREINLLSEMGSWLQSCQAVGEAYAVIGKSAEQLFPEWSGALYVISASRNSMEAVADWGKPCGSERVFVPDDCWALRRGQPHWFAVGGTTTNCHHTDPTRIVKALCVPLMAQGEALGILSLQLPCRPGEQESVSLQSDEAEQRLAAIFAEHVGLALGNLKLRETLKNQSIRDPLTGLFNRRYMEDSLEREISRANRHKSSVAIIMMDLDHFKTFNDTFGHQAGDALLRAFGDFLIKNTRGQDIACRYGGEEFAAVMSDANLAGALKRADILREEIKQLKVHYGGQLLGMVSLSIGVALFPDHGATSAEVVRAADQALYSAKRDGRDQVRACVFGSETVQS